MLLPEATKAVAAGHSHTLCLAESGNVWAVGSNARGQLGTGSASLPQPLPRRIAGLSSAALPLSSQPLSSPLSLQHLYPFAVYGFSGWSRKARLQLAKLPPTICDWPILKNFDQDQLRLCLDATNLALHTWTPGDDVAHSPMCRHRRLPRPL